MENNRIPNTSPNRRVLRARQLIRCSYSLSRLNIFLKNYLGFALSAYTLFKHLFTQNTYGHVISEQKQNSALWSQLSERDMLSPNYHTDEHIVTNCDKERYFFMRLDQESFFSWMVSGKVFPGNDT